MIERYQSRVVKLTYAIPPEVKHIKDLDARGYCMIRVAAAQAIGMISSVTPSSVLQIAEWVAQFGPRLVRDPAEGTLDRNLDIPGRIRDQIAACVRRRQPLLARNLDQAIELNGVLRPKDIWRPVMISCWLGGTVGYSSKRIPEHFGDSPIRDQGLLSSEGRHTVPLADGIPYGPLAVGSNYYEFIPVEETVNSTQNVLEAHELEEDKLYRIIMTTFGGMYRQAGEFLRAFDSALCEKVHIYGVLRRNRLLDMPLLARIPTGAWRHFIAREVAIRGRGDSQYKHKPLAADPQFLSRLRVIDTLELGNDGQVRSSVSS